MNRVLQKGPAGGWTKVRTGTVMAILAESALAPDMYLNNFLKPGRGDEGERDGAGTKSQTHSAKTRGGGWVVEARVD